LTEAEFIAYDIQAMAQYFKEEVGSSRPNSLPFIGFAEGLSTKSFVATSTISLDYQGFFS
jgi:hypothetical protein